MATLYTVIESCKKLELDPRFYIGMVIRKQISGEKERIPTPLEYTSLEYAGQIRENKTA